MYSVVIIPARLASTRLPRKALKDIHGKPVIQRCYEGCLGAEGIDDIYVATPDQELVDIVDGFGGKAVLTGPQDTAMGRSSEATRILRASRVVIVQGDEPMVRREMIPLVLRGLEESNIAELVSPVGHDEDVADKNMIKVVLDSNDFFLYVSRAVLPTLTPEDHGPFTPVHHKVLGMFAFDGKTLEKFLDLPMPDIEVAEGVDILRYLFFGHPVKAIMSPHDTQSLDCQADLDRIREIWGNT